MFSISSVVFLYEADAAWVSDITLRLSVASLLPDSLLNLTRFPVADRGGVPRPASSNVRFLLTLLVRSRSSSFLATTSSFLLLVRSSSSLSLRASIKATCFAMRSGLEVSGRARVLSYFRVNSGKSVKNPSLLLTWRYSTAVFTLPRAGGT